MENSLFTKCSHSFGLTGKSIANIQQQQKKLFKAFSHTHISSNLFHRTDIEFSYFELYFQEFPRTHLNETVHKIIYDDLKNSFRISIFHQFVVAYISKLQTELAWVKSFVDRIFGGGFRIVKAKSNLCKRQWLNGCWRTEWKRQRKRLKELNRTNKHGKATRVKQMLTNICKQFLLHRIFHFIRYLFRMLWASERVIESNRSKMIKRRRLLDEKLKACENVYAKHTGHCHSVIYRPNNGSKCWEWQPKQTNEKINFALKHMASLADRFHYFYFLSHSIFIFNFSFFPFSSLEKIDGPLLMLLHCNCN